jgi:predicted amidophosphoribosyltransferase
VSRSAKRSRIGRGGCVGAGETMELHRTDFLPNTGGQLVVVTYSASAVFEGDIKDLIVKFKYEHNKSLASLLARSMMNSLGNIGDCDMVTWIPTVLERKSEETLAQSAETNK